MPELLIATEIAKEFLAKAGYPFVWLDRAELDKSKDQWRLSFELGLYQRQKKTVIVQDSTGKVVGFE